MKIITHEIENREKLTVLVIEDDMVTRGVLTSILGKLYTVVEAEDGRSGIAAFIVHAPDVVFLDIHLPDLTGYEVLKRLKLLNQDAYIVMLSADEADERLILAHAEGAAGFIKKPFLREEIIDCVERSRHALEADPR